MHSEVYELICFKLGMTVDAAELYLLILVGDLDLDSRSQACGKGKKHLCQLSHKAFSRFGWNLACCRDLLIWWTSHTSYLNQLELKTENMSDFALERKKNNVDLHSDIYRPLSLKLGIVIKLTQQYGLIPVWTSLTFIEGRICMGKQEILCLFSCTFFNLHSQRNLVCCLDLSADFSPCRFKGENST